MSPHFLPHSLLFKLLQKLYHLQSCALSTLICTLYAASILTSCVIRNLDFICQRHSRALLTTSRRRVSRTSGEKQHPFPELLIRYINQRSNNPKHGIHNRKFHPFHPLTIPVFTNPGHARTRLTFGAFSAMASSDKVTIEVVWPRLASIPILRSWKSLVRLHPLWCLSASTGYLPVP